MDPYLHVTPSYEWVPSLRMNYEGAKSCHLKASKFINDSLDPAAEKDFKYSVEDDYTPGKRQFSAALDYKSLNMKKSQTKMFEELRKFNPRKSKEVSLEDILQKKRRLENPVYSHKPFDRLSCEYEKDFFKDKGRIKQTLSRYAPEKSPKKSLTYQEAEKIRALTEECKRIADLTEWEFELVQDNHDSE
jgi:hypothetical protein